MKFSFFTRKKKRAKLIKSIIADVVRTGIGPPPEFFTLAEFKELQTRVDLADEYYELFATVEYPEILQEGYEMSFDGKSGLLEVEQNESGGGYSG